MNPQDVPWLEIALVLPLLGALIVRFLSEPLEQWKIALATAIGTLVCSTVAWAYLPITGVGGGASVLKSCTGQTPFAIDALSAPLVCLVALLHVLTVLTTSRVKMNRLSFTGHLFGESIRMATFACMEPWPLIALLAFGTVPPFLEMVNRKKPIRIYAIHMGLFVLLLVSGWAAVRAELVIGPMLLLLAVLLRSGTFPMHLWVADLFENATFGTALLFVTPVVGMYAAIRLVLPVAPEWVLQSIGVASLITALYASGLALVQKEARRFFAYLFLSHASIVLVGLELHTTTSLTGALCLWISVALSLGGLGLCLRALEARHGRLSLTKYRGLYEQSPSLAIGFLLMALGSVGFPGTLGFIATELLVDGAVEANLFVGVVLILTSMINGIAIIRVYLLLFTGTRYQASIPMGITSRERFAILTLCGLILGGGLIPQVGVTNRHASAVELMPAKVEN